MTAINHRVYKYPAPSDGRSEFSLDMPEGAEILSVALQFSSPCIWAKVDPSAPDETRRFRWAGTGHPLPPDGLKFIGTILKYGGEYVWHLFEIV